MVSLTDHKSGLLFSAAYTAYLELVNAPTQSLNKLNVLQLINPVINQEINGNIFPPPVGLWCELMYFNALQHLLMPSFGPKSLHSKPFTIAI